MFQTQLYSRQNQLREKIATLEKQIDDLPEGKLLFSKNGNYTKWYVSNGSHPIYISKKNRDFAEALATKNFYLTQLESLTKEFSFLSDYLEHFPAQTNLSKITDSSSYQELLTPLLQDFPPDIQEWMDAPYPQHTKHSEHLIHKTRAGHFVRSKSENIIANTLFQNHIPYRYECELSLGDFIFYPDFTILHPVTRELFYWEHFGMMDHPSYSENTFHKLNIYASHGIYPSINLITTYETANHPIDSIKIQKLVEEFFGSV